HVTSAGCARSALLADGGGVPSPRRLETAARFDADALLAQMDELCERSPRRNTGECVHGCGLGDGRTGGLLLVREDIGRHNAMDKLIGQAWLDRVPLDDKALFITGRISCEMALKAHRAGCPVLVSRKSATDEAARRAEELGVTLVSHCRDGRLRVLSCPDRIAG
ncbi:sulfurtransferase FdhD, partial [Gordonibacter urolithinfaciens]